MSMVDPETFEEASKILREEILAAYEGQFLVPPVEIAPGFWELWPERRVRAILEETYYWFYGVPKGASGRLQAHIEYPYNDVRIHAKKGEKFGRKEARRAAKQALELSKRIAEHYHSDTIESQQAYLAGYDLIGKLSDEEVEEIWRRRRETFQNQRADWQAMWDSIKAHTGEEIQDEGVLEWMPFLTPSPYTGSDFGSHIQGALDAIDDWAMERGLLKVKVGPTGERWFAE